MSAEPLTSDNIYLSELNNLTLDNSDCRYLQSKAQAISYYVSAGISENTRRTYRSDLAHFQAWGGRIPSEPAAVAAYLADNAAILSPATLARRIATLSKAHAIAGFPNPCRSEIVNATLRGIKRVHGTAQRQAKPLLKEDLFLVLDAMGDGTRDVRDRALLLLGFAGGFRRSELVGLDCADIATVRQGLIITLRRSKTDQEGAGRKIGIPPGLTRHCPVMAMQAWLDRSKISEGPIFPPVDRHSHIRSGRLTGEAVSLIIKGRVRAAGIDPTGFSGHSLRAGFVTSAAQAGVGSVEIRAQTGHTSDATLAHYVRTGQLFNGNAAGALL